MAAFLFIAALWTWPLAAHLNSRGAHDPGDPLFGAWLFWWNAQRVPFAESWWNPPIFFPMRGALALAEHLAGLAPFSTPLILAGLSPLGSYNVVLILTFALSGFFAYLLVTQLTGSRLAGFCGGLAFGFSPYRTSQLAHIQVLASFWMPLALLGLHRYLAGGRWPWLAVFGVAWLLQALSNGYYLFFFPVLIALWIAWFVDWRRSPRTGLAIGIAWFLSSLPLVPVLLKYRAVHQSLGLSRPPEEVERYSATLASFLHAGPLLKIAPSHAAPNDETFLYPGVVVLALVLAAAVIVALQHRERLRTAFARRSPFLFYGAAALLMWLLALGPNGPYKLLSYLPGFESLRVPARFAMLATLCIAVAAGIAVSRFVRRHVLAGALCAAGLALDGWPRPMPLFAPPPRIILPDIPNAVVVELPTDDAAVSVSAMYRSMFHQRPIVGGYSGHTPPHAFIFAASLWRHDASVLLELSRGRPVIIVVDDRRAGFLRPLVRDLPSVERRHASGAGEIYVIPALAASRDPRLGPRLPHTVDETTGDRRLDLGALHTVRTIEVPLKWRYMSLHTRLTFEASADGSNWTTVWDDWTGGPSFAAAIRDPREAPVRVTLADVTARYLRFGPAPEWMWREIRLHGP